MCKLIRRLRRVPITDESVAENRVFLLSRPVVTATPNTDGL